MNPNNIMNFHFSRWSVAILVALRVAISPVASGQVPAVIHYQGRVFAEGKAFVGTGQFKFALVNAQASATYWQNAPDADGDGEPDSAVPAPVTGGLYSVLLGDSSLQNMASFPNNLFNNSAVYLRVWFSDGGGFEHLVPDQRLAAVGYAMIASTVSDGAITLSKLAADALGAIQNAASNSRADSLQTQFDALAARVDRLSSSQISFPAGLTAASADSADAALMAGGFVPFSSTTAPPWIYGSVQGAPTARSGHTAVWAGDTWIVWGGDMGGGLASGNGAIYRPSLDQWDSISAAGPEPRSDHSAVWTGEQMIIWGGFGAGQYLNSGGSYRPQTREWTPVSSIGAPSGRIGQVAVWTGSRLLVWGGLNADGLLNDGALYDPSTGLWTPLNLPNPPEARQGAAFAWAGDRLILWGGTGVNGSLNTGAQLRFAGDAPSGWSLMNPSSAPSPRAKCSIIWTGQKIIVWGGTSAGAFRSDGAYYIPAIDQWQRISSTQAPSARAEHAAIWTGSEMLVLGGDSESGVVGTGGAYDPAKDRWRALSNGGNVLARSGATAAWTGSEALVFGGRSGETPLGALQRVNPQPTWIFYRKP